MPTPNTKEMPGPLDAFETAKPGEPIFTLQGGDPLAAPLVHLWVERARALAASETDPHPKAADLLLRAREAEAVAWSMEEYRRGEVEAAPTKPTEGYSGFAPSAEMIASLERYDALLSGSRRLDNALYEANETAQAMRLLGLAHEALRIEQAVSILREAAVAIRPTRD